MSSQGFLFVNFAHEKRTRASEKEREVRRHVMRDIGKARRKNKNLRLPLKLHPPGQPPAPTLPQPEEILQPLQSVDSIDQNAWREEFEIESRTSEPSFFPCPSRPFRDQNPFQILEDSWGMDPFASCSLALVVIGNTQIQNCILRKPSSLKFQLKANLSQHRPVRYLSRSVLSASGSHLHVPTRSHPTI
jgi:hypothetical protein